MSQPQTIGVIGAGTMGSNIAQVCAVAGLVVVMIDVNNEHVARANAAVASGFDRLVTKAKLSAGERDDAKYGPTPLLKQRVAKGKLGRKSGRGFHTYA